MWVFWIEHWRTWQLCQCNRYQEFRFFGVCLLRALTVQVFSPEWIYVDVFSRTGLKENVPAVLLEMLHPVKKYCLLTDDSPWPMSQERGSIEVRVIPLFQSTCMTGGDSGCGRLRSRELLVPLNEREQSSLRSMDVILQLYGSLRCATVFSYNYWRCGEIAWIFILW